MVGGHLNFDDFRNVRLSSISVIVLIVKYFTSLLIRHKEHFYLEPQFSLALPKGEHDEMEIISSTQWPSKAQVMLCYAGKQLQMHIIFIIFKYMFT